MEILQGTATVTRQESRASVSLYAMLLEIDGRPVTLSLPEVIVVSDGDFVAVAGVEKRGLFRAFAYKNVTRSVVGKSKVAVPLLGGIAFCCTVLLLPVGLIWGLLPASRNHRAFKLVTDIKLPDRMKLQE